MKRWISVQSMNSMTQTTLALKQYELREGKLPESLAVLVPDYLPAVPLDYVGSPADPLFANGPGDLAAGHPGADHRFPEDVEGRRRTKGFHYSVPKPEKE